MERLGHIAGCDILKPKPDKVSAIREAENSATKRQVPSFLSMIGFYMKFIPNYASIAAPLTDLTRKGQPNKFVWGEAQENFFQKLKSALCNFIILHLPDFDKSFVLQTDSSNVGKAEEVKKPVA